MCIYFNKSHLLCPSSRRHTKKRSVRGIFRVPRSQSHFGFSFKNEMGWQKLPCGISTCNKGNCFPCPRFETFPVYIYKVMSSIFNALYKDHKITQYITQTECWLDAFTLISNLYLK